MAGSPRQPVYQSGECEIDLGRRELRIRGASVPIGSRAFEIMTALVQAGGELVGKDAMLRRIWPGITVGESAIHVHISAIRKALGPYRATLQTDTGRGYRLLGPWTMRNDDRSIPPPARPTAAGPTNLPVAVTELIGRAASLQFLQQACSAYRVVTLTGPGGIGKTTLAIELARSLVSGFDDGTWLVELASLSDPGLVPLAVAEAIGLQTSGGPVSAESVARGIGRKRLLLVLDNCEHLIDAAAQIVESIVRLSPHVAILATSRETLRAGSELIYRVPPLDVPRDGPDEAADAQDHSAVELFLARTDALGITRLRDEQNLRLIGRICRRLDGIPLAIEFAAARAAALGVSQVASGLEDRFALLTSGRRTALPRHRTLRAALDWSYALLPDAERRRLRCLAIFPAGFVLDAAVAVMHDSLLAEVADDIANLVEKSIVIFDRSAPSGRLRLLETVRAYGLEKLAESGEQQQIARRHAEFFRDFFATFDPDAGVEGDGDDLARYMREVDNLRAALAWAFSASGDASLGIAVAAAAEKFWLAASLLDECCHWTGKALVLLDGTGNTEQEMVLRSGLGLAVLFSQGMTPVAHENLTRTLAIAEARGSIEYQQRAVYGLWLFNMRSMPLRNALALGRRYADLASSDTDPAAMHMADVLMGTALTYLGEFIEAIGPLERAIRRYPTARRYRDLARRGIDPRTSAFAHLSVGLFLRGLIDTAIRVGEQSIEEARQVSQPVALCLAMAPPVCLQFPGIGAFDTAERHIAALLAHADRYALGTFHAIAMCARGHVLVMRGDPRSGAAMLHSSLAHLEATGYLLYSVYFRGRFAEALGVAGNVDEGLAEAEAAARHAEQLDYMWLLPELTRIHGSLIANGIPGDRPAAEQLFLRAIAQAQRQQALYWELCAALSLVEVWQLQGRRAEAHALLRPICQRFTEGFTTPVLVRAKAILRDAAAC